MTKHETDRILDKLSEQFMQPEIWQGDIWQISANHGETHYIPADVVGTRQRDAALFSDYVEGTPDTDEDGNVIAELRQNVWCARLSAPGYMDQTDLSVFDTEDEAREYLADTYGGDLDLEEDEPNEPDEEDITTDDHRTFYYCGKVIAEVADEEDWRPIVAAWCKAHNYYPNVWWISDHGNAHILSMFTE